MKQLRCIAVSKFRFAALGCGPALAIYHDDWAWYTCPECGNSVRIIDGVVTWHSEIFGNKAATYGGRTCEYCEEPLAGGEYTGPWENGNNSNGYIKCPHCRSVNFEPNYDD